MSNFLEQMAAGSRERSRRAQAATPAGVLLERALAAPEPLPLALGAFDLIAEFKLRSPATGALAAERFDPAAQLAAYAAGGAAAVSVLTEPDEFRGALGHLESAAALLRPSGCPVMRKDFLVDSYQVIEARAAGASGILLIAAMLSDDALAELLATAAELGLFALLEAFDRDDLERIERLTLPADGPRVLVGINSRDLRTLAVDFERFARLADRVRPDLPAVAESGIDSAEAIAAVAGLGYRAALVGSALMRGGNAAGAVADFVAAGRRAVAEMD